ncbi:MAG: DMT family transporter [bacterium]|nr:DMT family transporter [bacterium]
MQTALLSVLGFAFFYGLTTVLQQIMVRTSIDPIHLNYLTYLTGSVIIFIYLIFRDKKSLTTLKPKSWWYGSWVGISGSIIADLSVLIGLTLSSSINWGILSRLSIFGTFFLSVLFLKEKITKNKILAAFISFIGATLVVYNIKSGITFNFGDLLFLIGMLGFSVSNVLNQKAFQYATTSQLVFIRFVITSLIMGIIVFLFHPIQNINQWPFIIFNAITYVIGISLVNITIQKGGATFFAIGSNLVVVVIALLSIFILKEIPSIFQILGATLIVGSVFIFQKGTKIVKAKNQ